MNKQRQREIAGILLNEGFDKDDVLNAIVALRKTRSKNDELTRGEIIEYLEDVMGIKVQNYDTMTNAVDQLVSDGKVQYAPRVGIELVNKVIINTAKQNDISNAWPNVFYVSEPHDTPKPVMNIYKLARVFDSNLKKNGVEDFQEVYLGYDQSKDVFFIGFDVFDNEIESAIIKFVWTGGTGSADIELKGTTTYKDEGIFYPRIYKKVKSNFDLIDLRLD